MGIVSRSDRRWARLTNRRFDPKTFPSRVQRVPARRVNGVAQDCWNSGLDGLGVRVFGGWDILLSLLVE